MKKGFTLIELLVVVLIIGILSSVALPQYQKAVYKARVNRVWALLKSIKDAQEVYYMANGTYTDDLSPLDIQIPKGDVHSIITSGEEIYSNGTCINNLAGSATDPTKWYAYGGYGDDCGNYKSESVKGCYLYVYFDHHAKGGALISNFANFRFSSGWLHRNRGKRQPKETQASETGRCPPPAS